MGALKIRRNPGNLNSKSMVLQLKGSENTEFKMGCCDNIIKYVIFLFNFVVFLCSVALIGIGAYIQVQMNKYLDFLGDTYLNTSVILIIIGGVMLLISFFE